MPDDAAAQLTELKAEREELTAKMVTARDELVAQVAAELPKRWDDYVRRWINTFPDEAKALGTEGMRPVRERLRSLDPSEVAERHFAGPWAHDGLGWQETVFRATPASSPSYSTEPPAARIDGIRHALEQAVREMKDVLAATFDRTWQATDDDVGPQLQKHERNYGVLAQQRSKLLERIRDLERSMSVTEATDIWDQTDH